MDTLALKNYRIIKKIGQGGMGVVYLAEDLSLGRMVALKFLAPYLIKDPEILKRFRAEARSQARLMHPNITLVYAFEEVGDQAFLVLEYVKGETLEHRIKEEGRIPTRETAAILGKVLRAMHYAHGMGVIHRDIKPANIGFTPEGEVKLMDFGIALNLAESNRLTRTGHILGTPHYMAPEQILGQPLKACTDIYALGITLYEMLAGKVPFEGDSDYAVSVAQINDPPPSLLSFGYDDITRDVEEVVFRALAKNPQERFHTAREFRLALEAAADRVSRPDLGDKPAPDKATQAINPSIKEAALAPEPPQSGPLPSTPRGRHWRWVGTLAAGGGVLMLAALMWLFRPVSLSTWFTPTTATPSKTSQAKPSSAAAEKVVQATSPPLRPSQPEETRAAEAREKKELTQEPSPTSPNLAQKEKVITPPVTMAAAPLTLPPREPVIPMKKEKTPADYLSPIKAKLNKQGFSDINTWLDEKGRLVIAGQAKTSAQKEEIISLVKSSGFPGGVDFDQLTVVKRVAEKPVRKKVVRESIEVRESPAPAPAPPVAPMKPLGPKLD
jgi:serine/threonine protein kinase